VSRSLYAKHFSTQGDCTSTHPSSSNLESPPRAGWAWDLRGECCTEVSDARQPSKFPSLTRIGSERARYRDRGRGRVRQRGIRRRVSNAPRIRAFAFDVYAAGAHSPRCSIRHTPAPTPLRLRLLSLIPVDIYDTKSALCLLFLLIHMTPNPPSVSFFF
jgi:hypothetical protein